MLLHFASEWSIILVHRVPLGDGLRERSVREEGALTMKACARKLVVGAVAALLLLAVAQPALAAEVHVVRSGESLWSIAVSHGTTIDAIARANGLSNTRVIYVGQRLTIPGGGGGGGSTASGGAYVVRAGDTLSGIAARYGTSVAALMRANGLRGSLIYPGQRLTISGGGTSGGGAQPSASGGQVYVVRPGDSVSAIAYRYGTTVAAIANANGLANASRIYVGQRLRIPSGSGGGAAPAPAAGGAKRIVVDISAQRMYVYQNGQLVWNWVVSTGARGSTAVGHFKVLNKIPNAWASTWSLTMPYWLGIYWSGRLQNGIHALPIMANGQTLWAGYLGTPVSYGCVILSTQNAAALYNWAQVGTPVDIVW
jgi:LysM repeat protein